MNTMRFHSTFADKRFQSPDPVAWTPLFEPFNPALWVAEAYGGVLTFTDESRATEYTLTLVSAPNGGIVVQYCRQTTAPRRRSECKYVVADRSKLDEFIDVDCDLFYPLGCIVPASLAWNAVEDFLRDPTVESPRVEWVNDPEIQWPIV